MSISTEQESHILESGQIEDIFVLASPTDSCRWLPLQCANCQNFHSEALHSLHELCKLYVQHLLFSG